MMAEHLSLGESTGRTTTPSRRQFSLQSLFFFSLRISPLLLALVFVREFLSLQMPSAVLLFNCLACTALYGGIFAARTEIRRPESLEKQPSRSILPATRTGAGNGALFLVLAVGPAILAQLFGRGAIFDELVWLQKYWSPANAFHVLRLVAGYLLEFAKAAGLLAFFGFFLGAAGGAVAGTVIEKRKRPPAGAAQLG